MQSKTQEQLEGFLGTRIKAVRPVSGGDIAQAYLIETSTQQIFCKILQGKSGSAMLNAEMQGLNLIGETGSVKTPEVFFCQSFGNQACLGLEYIEAKNPAAGEMHKLGEQLAQMHKSISDLFGLAEDNFIGSLPQSNKQHASWDSFYVQERLLPQFQMALSRGLMHAREIPDTPQMVETLSPYFEDVSPALLHGDLWSGNYLISKAGEPYLIDPAVYYGDPIVDLAMSRLFGGFGADFYQAYYTNFSAQAMEDDKTQLYQLYYLLVHLNLFGGSYYSSVKRIMNRYF